MGCCTPVSNFFAKLCGAMSLDETRQSQRPYRYGMVLLCIGALINWLGLAENYVEPVRYIGVACIIAGALLICAAMCCWLQAPGVRAPNQTSQPDEPIHVITVSGDDELMQQKPPDYDSVAGAPPTYDDAIKLNPACLPSVHAPSNSGQRPAERRPEGSSGQHQRLEIIVTDVARRPQAPPVPKTPPPPYRSVGTAR